MLQFFKSIYILITKYQQTSANAAVNINQHLP